MKKTYNKNNNYLRLKKKNINVNINISQNSFLNNTFTSLNKKNIMDFNFIRNNKYKMYYLNKSNILKSKILKNKKSIINSKMDRIKNKKDNCKNISEIKNLKTFINISKIKNSNVYNHTNLSRGKHILINQKKKKSKRKQIIISSKPIGRNDKINILKFTIENISLNNKIFSKQLLSNK